MKNIGYTKLNKKLIIDSLRLNPISNKEFIEQLINKKKSTLIDVLLPKMTIDNFNISAFTNDKKIIADSIYISQPQLLLVHKSSNKPSEKEEQDFKLERFLPDEIDVVSLGEITIDNAAMFLEIGQLNETKQINLNEFNSSFKNVMIDKENPNSKFLSSDQVIFHIKDYNIVSPKGNYNITTHNIGFSVADSFLYVDNLHFWDRRQSG